MKTAEQPTIDTLVGRVLRVLKDPPSVEARAFDLCVQQDDRWTTIRLVAAIGLDPTNSNQRDLAEEAFYDLWSENFIEWHGNSTEGGWRLTEPK